MYAPASSSPTRERVITMVNALLARESCSLMQRLREAEPFISAGSAEAALAIQELVNEDAHHAERLVALLDQLDATPGPRGVEIDTGDLHYNQIHTLLPRLIADQKKFIADYESALTVAAGEPQVTEVLSTVLASHRRHLARLEELAAPRRGS